MEPPTEKQKIINRIIDSINSRKKRIKFAESIGINPIWVKDQYKKQLIFGPGEQMNPFITIHSYSLDENDSFHSLREEIKKEEEIEYELNNQGINSKWALLTLKHNSFSSDGETALYHFRKIKGDPVYLFSRKERSKYSHSPYSEVYIKTERLLQILDEINKDGMHANNFNKRAIQRFSEDVHYSIRNSNKNETLGHINYLDFCKFYNEKSLSQFRSDATISSIFVDELGLDSFISEGVIDWNIFLNFLLNSKIINLGEPIFLLRVEGTNNKNKIVRLGLSDIPLVFNGKSSTNDILFLNYDFKIRGYGHESYRLSYLEDMAHDGNSMGVPSVMPAKGIEYLLFFGGFTNFFVGDDGLPFRDIDNVIQILISNEIAPSFFGYCPQDQVLSRKTGSKNIVYIFNESLSTIGFYNYLIEESL